MEIQLFTKRYHAAKSPIRKSQDSRKGRTKHKLATTQRCGEADLRRRTPTTLTKKGRPSAASAKAKPSSSQEARKQNQGRWATAREALSHTQSLYLCFFFIYMYIYIYNESM
jgi:hypothetical protein